MSELILHDFLRNTLVSTYKECIYCKSRTQFTCVKCGYCYSCHWKKEELDRVRLETSTTANSAISQVATTTTTIVEQPTAPTAYKQQPQQQEKAIDVYGQETEPICSYRRCHHKFSEHRNRNCKCHHAVNYATGVSISRLTKIEVL
jgi:hypothetical protein